MTIRHLRLTLLILALTLVSCVTPTTYKGLMVRYPTLLALAREGNELIYETAWCLVGEVKDGVVRVDEVSAPLVQNRTTSSAMFSGCNHVDGLVGWYHNHPPQPYDVCRPSPADSTVLVNNPSYHVLLLTCNGTTFVYRFQGDTIDYRIEHTDYLPAGMRP